MSRETRPREENTRARELERMQQTAAETPGLQEAMQAYERFNGITQVASNYRVRNGRVIVFGSSNRTA